MRRGCETMIEKDNNEFDMEDVKPDSRAFNNKIQKVIRQELRTHGTAAERRCGCF